MPAWVKDLSRNGPTWDPNNKPYSHFNRDVGATAIETVTPEYAGERVIFNPAVGPVIMYQAVSMTVGDWVSVAVNTMRG